MRKWTLVKVIKRNLPRLLWNAGLSFWNTCISKQRVKDPFPPTPVLQIQLPADVYGRQQMAARVIEVLPPTWETWTEFQSRPSPGWCGHLKNKPLTSWSLSLSPSLCKLVFQQNSLNTYKYVGIQSQNSTRVASWGFRGSRFWSLISYSWIEWGMEGKKRRKKISLWK